MYEKDREEVAQKAIIDFNIGQNYEVMENIALSLPMSRKMRPVWDREKLLEIGFKSVDICDDIWRLVWTEDEKTNYTSTPMFRIAATK